MSPCCGLLVSLLVLLGVTWTSGSPVQCIAPNLQRDHDLISEALKLKEPNIGVNPLFNTSCLKRDIQLINMTLDIYGRIFSSILQHDSTASRPALLDQVPDRRSEVKEALRNLHKRLKTLLLCLNEDREEEINKLNNLTLDDPVVQRKALAQFLEIFQVVSVGGSCRCGHRHSSSAK